MGFEELLETGNLIKFAILFIPLSIYIFYVADTLKWKLLLTVGVFIGVAIALSGKTLGREHSLGGRR
ncbi:hypothetical protein LCGC14_0538240 [marine sediment metagenome]|uniref:Uncharacterized protein n=1 Tax=marine sediment metagenome TaxID=412755 RepID=A0A0F9UF29_9ZZZZ|nr:hypothetical protein [bacterium]